MKKKVKTSPLRSMIDAGTGATHQAVDLEEKLADADEGPRALVRPRAVNHVASNAGKLVIFELIASSRGLLQRQ